MRNEGMERLETLVGEWDLTLSDAWFLEPPGKQLHGRASITWLDDAFLVLRSELDGKPLWDIVIGYSDATGRYVLLYHDERGVSRVFDMTFGGGRWEWSRSDPDFSQTFSADVTQDRISGRTDASDDGGATWRKDFDLLFTRSTGAGNDQAHTEA